MRSQLRSELVKLRSTRTNVGLLGAMIGLVLLIVILTGVAVKPAELMKAEHQRAMLGLGLAGGFLAALIGVMSITSEYRHGTIRPTFIFTPKRSRVLAAKVISAVAVGAVFGLLTEALAFGTGIAILLIRGAHVILSPRELVLIALGSVAATALMAALGVGVGAILRNQVLAVIGFVIWFMVIENLVLNFAHSVGKYLPLSAGDALSETNSNLEVTAVQGGLLLSAYVGAFFIAGLVAINRRDVN